MGQREKTAPVGAGWGGSGRSKSCGVVCWVQAAVVVPLGCRKKPPVKGSRWELAVAAAGFALRKEDLS